MKTHFLIFLFFCFCNQMMAQEVDDENSPHHKITIVMGNTHLPSGIENGNKKNLIISSWGLDYDYWLSKKWGIGLHSDILLQNFRVESFTSVDEIEVIKRNFPISFAIVGSFKVNKHLSLMFGPGIETSEGEKSFWFLKAGIEYGWELPNNFELGLSIIDDYRFDAYNSWTFGLSVSKLLFK